MKTVKILLIVAIALLASLLFRTCEKSDSSLNETEVLKSFSESRHTITIDQAQNLYENYKTRFIPTLKEIQKDPGNGMVRANYLPTEYSLIPIQKLKDYIAFLDVLQQKNPNQEITGIAINFGAYNLDVKINDDTSASSKTDPIRVGDYRGRLTTFFTPTFYDKNVQSDYAAEKHIPFYIDYNDESDKFTGTFMPIENYDKQPNDKASVNHNKANKSLASSIPSLLSSLANSNTATIGSKGQSASMNEFTDMPPKR